MARRLVGGQYLILEVVNLLVVYLPDLTWLQASAVALSPHQALQKTFLIPSKDCCSYFLPFEKNFFTLWKVSEPAIVVHIYMFDEDLVCYHLLIAPFALLVWECEKNLKVFG